MSHILYQVDAFTGEPFKGNPAAVCLLERPESDDWMQSLASEMNLSETAFLLPEGDDWRLRWFTPKTEVDLCGHATLASAMTLFTIHPNLREAKLKFLTKSGELLAEWAEGKVVLDFPAMNPEPLTVPHQVTEALGFQPIGAVFSGNYFLFEAWDSRQILDADPDMDGLARLPMPEVIITARNPTPDFDFISRFFAPQLGVSEDPVTGSAHCLLAPFWGEKLGKKHLTAYQASKRGGVLGLEWVGERVLIQGSATFILKAELLI
jgi:PhzF family phenazine biosynthesis protein